MSNYWTSKEIKEAVYLVRFGVDYAAQQLGRSEEAIEKAVRDRGVPRKAFKKHRQLYADNIAHMMELRMLGFGFKTIARCFNTTAKSVESAIYKARQRGFDAYPKRSF